MPPLFHAFFTFSITFCTSVTQFVTARDCWCILGLQKTKDVWHFSHDLFPVCLHAQNSNCKFSSLRKNPNRWGVLQGAKILIERRGYAWATPFSQNRQISFLGASGSANEPEDNRSPDIAEDIDIGRFQGRIHVHRFTKCLFFLEHK